MTLIPNSVQQDDYKADPIVGRFYRLTRFSFGMTQLQLAQARDSVLFIRFFCSVQVTPVCGDFEGLDE